MTEAAFYKKRLKTAFAERCDRNSRYSVRAFSKALGIDAGTLSKILAGKQVPSHKLSLRLADGIGLEPDERDRFLASVAEVQRARGLQRMSPAFRVDRGDMGHAVLSQSDLSIDLFRIIADWYHTAILELTFVEGFKPDPAWIAGELGISRAEATLAVERLIEFGLLERDVRGRLRKTSEQLTTTDKSLTTPALRKNQRQFLEKAIDSLENDPIEERSMTSMTLAIDPEKLPLAKQLVRQFNQALCRLLESGKRKRVYNLEVALYPLQKNPTKKEKSK